MVIDLALGVAVVWSIGASSSTYEVEGLGPAIVVAFAMSAAGWFLAIPLTAVYGHIYSTIFGYCAQDCSDRMVYLQLTGMLLGFVVDVPLLLLVGLLVPGVEVRGIGGAAAIAAGLAVVGLLVRALPSVATAA
jgi:hypothetical protein